MLVSQSQYARMKGVSRQYISALIAEGVLVRTPDGRIDTEVADAVFAERPQPFRVE